MSLSGEDLRNMVMHGGIDNELQFESWKIFQVMAEFVKFLSGGILLAMLFFVSLIYRTNRTPKRYWRRLKRSQGFTVPG